MFLLRKRLFRAIGPKNIKYCAIFLASFIITFPCSCDNNNNIKTELEPIKKRIPSLNNIIHAQWVVEQSPKQDSFFAPPTLDVRYIIKAIVQLEEGEYNNHISMFNDWIPCNLCEEIPFLNLDIKGISSSQIMLLWNQDAAPSKLLRIIFLKNNTIYLELECR